MTTKSGDAAEPVLFSGGNPQIAKGDAVVQRYIVAAEIPGALLRRLRGQAG